MKFENFRPGMELMLDGKRLFLSRTEWQSSPDGISAKVWVIPVFVTPERPQFASREIELPQPLWDSVTEGWGNKPSWPTGWVWINTDKKYHWFNERLSSLCGFFIYTGIKHDTRTTELPNDCPVCRQHLKMRNSIK